MKNLFLDKSDEELKVYFEQFQAWETLGIITDDELGEMRDLYNLNLGTEWKSVFTRDLLKAIAFRWVKTN